MALVTLREGINKNVLMERTTRFLTKQSERKGFKIISGFREAFNLDQHLGLIPESSIATSGTSPRKQLGLDNITFQ